MIKSALYSARSMYYLSYDQRFVPALTAFQGHTAAVSRMATCVANT